jgi:hypothetical protein
MLSKDAKASERKWRAESDLRALSEADEIRRDRSRVSAARGIARKQLTGLRRIAGGKR